MSNEQQIEEGTRNPSTPESQISHKNVKIKNEISEKKRKALKEYYKLRKQQSDLQKQTEQLEQSSQPVVVQEGDLETEILEDKPIKEIDVLNSEFKNIVADTNRLSSSINLINSSIKNIIYNNYYELIKLNDFLGNLNDLDLSKIEGLEAQTQEKQTNILDRLNIDTDQVQTNNNDLNTNDTSGLDKLNELMDKIEDFDKNDFSKFEETTLEKNENLTVLPVMDKATVEKDKPEIKAILEKLIIQLKDTKGSEILLNQLQDLQTLVNTTK